MTITDLIRLCGLESRTCKKEQGVLIYSSGEIDVAFTQNNHSVTVGFYEGDTVKNPYFHIFQHTLASELVKLRNAIDEVLR